MKMANGTNSMKAPPFPGTRGKSAALVRQKFIEAQEYREKLQRGLEDPNKAPARDIGMEGAGGGVGGHTHGPPPHPPPR